MLRLTDIVCHKKSVRVICREHLLGVRLYNHSHTQYVVGPRMD